MISCQPDVFFCCACLNDKPASEASPDPRYCQGCYDFLLKEAEMVAGHTRADWIPIKTSSNQKTGQGKVPPVSQVGGGIMSTVNDKKIEVDIIQPSVAKVTRGKRGPKHKTLPHKLIKHWAGEGMGSKAIASKLNNELGIKVSYKTIQRILCAPAKANFLE